MAAATKWEKRMCRIRPDSLLLSCWSPSTDTEEDMLRRFTMYSVDMAELPTYTPEEYNLYLKDDQWTKFETDYLLTLAREYSLNWHVMADRYSFGHERPRKRSVQEIKGRINDVYKRLPKYTHLADLDFQPQQARSDGDEEDAKKIAPKNALLRAIKRLQPFIDEKVPWIVQERTRIISLFAGDLFALPAALVCNAMMTSWPMPLSSSSSAKSSSHMKRKKKSSKHAKSFSEEFEDDGQLAALSFSLPLRREKSVIGPHARSTRMKPLRTGLTKHVEKVMLEFGLAPRPTVPQVDIINKYDQVRSLIMALIDERKATDKLESQLKIANPSISSTKIL